MDPLVVGSGWWRSLDYNDAVSLPTANFIVIKSQPVLPKMVMAPGSDPATQGTLTEQGDRIVLLDFDIAVRATLASIITLESREDPNSTAVRRIIKSWYCPATTEVRDRIQHRRGIAIPTREGVGGADACADLILGCYNSAGVLSPFDTQFTAALHLSVVASGVTVSGRSKRGWDGFNG